MPTRSARFWLEILILGFFLVFGMAVLLQWMPQPWASIVRILYAAALFGTYALHYERTWQRNDRS